MSKADELMEAKILAKGLAAPRVSPEWIDNTIVDKEFWRPENTTLTVCVLTLKNGTIVVGESACVSPENFDAEIGEDIAYSNAREKVWALEGYLLKERMYQDSNEHPDEDQIEDMLIDEMVERQEQDRIENL